MDVPAPAAERGQAPEHADTIDGIGPNASVEQLREALGKRVAMLRDRGVIDLDAVAAASE